MALDRSVRTLESATVANARLQARLLSQSGPIVPAAVAAGELRVVSAIYEIVSGVVRIV